MHSLKKLCFLVLLCVFSSMLFGQQTKKSKPIKPFDLVEMKREIDQVMEIYETYAEKYMDELKKMKDYDEMQASWDKVIKEENPVKKESLNKAFKSKYNNYLKTAITKSGITGSVIKSQVKKVLKLCDFELDRNTGSLMMYKILDNQAIMAYLGNCDVKTEFFRPSFEDFEETDSDDYFGHQGSIVSEENELSTASEYGSHEVVRKYTFEFDPLKDACQYRLEAAGDYSAKMVYYANICPVLVGMTTSIIVYGNDYSDVLFFKDDLRFATVLPFYSSDDYEGAVRPISNGNFNIDVDVHPYQVLHCNMTSRTSTFRFLCTNFAPQLFGGYVHAYTDIKITNPLRCLVYKYSY